jgi:hypothetical protein
MPEINITVREPNIEGVEELLDDLRALGEEYQVALEATSRVESDSDLRVSRGTQPWGTHSVRRNATPEA